MNSNPVISLQAVADLLPFRSVKIAAGGLDYAGAADVVVGHTLPGDLNRLYPSIQLHGSFIEAVLGNGTAVVRGDTLEQAANGTYVKRTAGTIVGQAWGGATTANDRFEAIIYRV